MGDNSKSVPVPGSILDTKESISRFARSIPRQKQSKSRVKVFEADQFKIEQPMASFAKQHVKITFDKEVG